MRSRNREKEKEARLLKYRTDPAYAEKERARCRAYMKKNRKRERAKHIETCRRATREYMRRWRKENKEESNRRDREKAAKNRATRPDYRIMSSARARISQALRGMLKTKGTKALLGCTPEELKTHLESLWQPGMTWENYGRFGWHVDHIKPCYLFDFSKPEDQQACFHFSNLRPMWWRDNITRTASAAATARGQRVVRERVIKSLTAREV